MYGEAQSIIGLLLRWRLRSRISCPSLARSDDTSTSERMGQFRLHKKTSIGVASRISPQLDRTAKLQAIMSQTSTTNDGETPSRAEEGPVTVTCVGRTAETHAKVLERMSYLESNFLRGGTNEAKSRAIFHEITSSLVWHIRNLLANQRLSC